MFTGLTIELLFYLSMGFMVLILFVCIFFEWVNRNDKDID